MEAALLTLVAHYGADFIQSQGQSLTGREVGSTVVGEAQTTLVGNVCVTRTERPGVHV